MKGLVKIFAVFIALVLIVIIGASVFVRFYLTDEKVQALVVPQAEKALGRSVTLGAIDVGLFSGITINGFAIKEKDGTTDFLKTNKFVLSYNLMPLLQKKLVISEILLQDPAVRVVRDKNGNLNFNTIAFLAQAAKKEEGADRQERAASAGSPEVPIAVSVESIRVTNGTLSFNDQKGELPEVQAIANLKVGLDLGQNLADIRFKGDLDTTADITYGETAVQSLFKAQFSQDQVSYAADIDVNQEKIHLEGTLQQFTTPDILLNVTSDALNIDKLMALAATLPKENKKKTAEPAQKETKPAAPIADSLPKGLHVAGKVTIKKALYQKLTINNFLLQHELSNGVLTVQELSAQTAGGSLASAITVDLNKAEPQYNGTMDLKSLEMSTLGNGLQQKFGTILSGALATSLKFDGSGFTPDTIKKNLSADASYALTNGQIAKTALTTSLSQITGIPDLKEISFEDMSGTVKLLKGGVIELITSLTGENLKAETKGRVSLDGEMDFPLLVTLSKSLTEKLDKKGTVSSFLANEAGETPLHLKLTGPLSSPKTILDAAGVKTQMTETVKKKALNELGSFLNKQQKSSTTDNAPKTQKESSPLQAPTKMLNNLFGR